MTVFSKVLYGSLSMVSADWLEPLSCAEWQSLEEEVERNAARDGSEQHQDHLCVFQPREILMRADTILTSEAPTFALRPTFANIHKFEALTECAVLDVLLPTYDDEAGRSCHYFQLAREIADDAKRRYFLESVLAPDELDIQRGEYCGPVIQI